MESYATPALAQAFANLGQRLDPDASPPQGQPLSPQQHNALAMGKQITQTGYCIVHETPMKWNEGKEGRKGWYSHRLGTGDYCNGRPGRYTK